MSEYTDDAYKALGVSPTATEREIKTAYRKLALQYHPDRQSDENQRDIATTKFVAIANAYEVLTDPYLRAEYNERRHCNEPATSSSPSNNPGTNNTTTTASPPNGNNKTARNNKSNNDKSNNDKSNNDKSNNNKSNKNTTATETSDIKHTPFRYHFSDPYEVFKRDFREQFGIDYPGAKYDWIDFSEPMVAPANNTTGNNRMITNDSHEEAPPPQAQPKKKGFNLFRRKQKDDPSKNDRQLVVRDNGTNKDLATSTNGACTDIVVAEKRNNRPISMDVQTTTDGPVTTTRTTITRPDGSTETITMRTGIPGKAPTKPNAGSPHKQITNGTTKGLVTNGTPSKSNTTTTLVKSNPNKNLSATIKSVSPSPSQQQKHTPQQHNKAKVGRIGK